MKNQLKKPMQYIIYARKSSEGEDRQIQSIDDQINFAKKRAKEKGLKTADVFDKTMIIILADHGGHAKTHGTEDPRDMTIPWICYGPGIKKGFEIKENVIIYDTAATIAYTLGLKIPCSWVGRPLKEIFEKNGK